MTSNAPTWTQIYDDYLASGKIGHCVNCHTQGASASSLYSFLSGAYINGTSSNMASIFGFMGGKMPPGTTTTDATATDDVNAWVAAGALDN